jgi:hypothetical protein
MLWYKSWLDTRWRFFVALGLLSMSAAGIVLTYPRVLALLPLVPATDAGGPLGERIRAAALLAREFRGYVWSQWFHGNARQEWTVVAALLGTGGLVAQDRAARCSRCRCRCRATACSRSAPRRASPRC